MSREYLDRYQYFLEDGKFRIVPGIEIPIKGTDKYVQFRKNIDRLDKISQEFYDSPTFGWLILLANPQAGSIEFEIPENYYLRIPHPLITSLQDYKRGVELYNIYYGEK
jgi:hypothetical protein